MSLNENESRQLDAMREFYDTVYHASPVPSTRIPSHLTRLAGKIGIRENQQVLDVACGTGRWLLACRNMGARVTGVDLSENAIAVCKTVIPDGVFQVSPAESLPFPDHCFDVVTCLGAVEHFVAPRKALQEMVRVGKPNAPFLILVPNADFLSRRLGLFVGTHQADAGEEVKTLEEWSALFGEFGLNVIDRWRDLHVVSWSWIAARRWYMIPVRAVQAVVLPLWPLRWQYQVYHLCTTKPSTV